MWLRRYNEHALPNKISTSCHKKILKEGMNVLVLSYLPCTHNQTVKLNFKINNPPTNPCHVLF